MVSNLRPELFLIQMSPEKDILPAGMSPRIRFPCTPPQSSQAGLKTQQRNSLGRLKVY